MTWKETIDKVREFDYELAEELNEKCLEVGQALLNILPYIIEKKENN